MPPPALTPLATALLRVPAPERALVTGCGDGEAALLVAREFPAARVRGVDRSADLIGAASARVGLDPEGRIAFKVGARRLPYPDGFFDLVVHLDPRPSVGETVRVLRPDGHLILVRPEAAAAWTERIAGALLRYRLERRGVALGPAEGGGDGNFRVGRLGEGGRPTAAI